MGPTKVELEKKLPWDVTEMAHIKHTQRLPLFLHSLLPQSHSIHYEAIDRT